MDRTKQKLNDDVIEIQWILFLNDRYKQCIDFKEMTYNKKCREKIRKVIEYDINTDFLKKHNYKK